MKPYLILPDQARIITSAYKANKIVVLAPKSFPKDALFITKIVPFRQPPPMRRRRDLVARMVALVQNIGRTLLNFDAGLAVVILVFATWTTVSGSSQPLSKTGPTIAIIAAASHATVNHIDAWVKNLGLDPINAIEKLDAW